MLKFRVANSNVYLFTLHLSFLVVQSLHFFPPFFEDELQSVPEILLLVFFWNLVLDCDLFVIYFVKPVGDSPLLLVFLNLLFLDEIQVCLLISWLESTTGVLSFVYLNEANQCRFPVPLKSVSLKSNLFKIIKFEWCPNNGKTVQPKPRK